MKTTYLFLFLILGFKLYAQEYPVRTFTIRDGLSQMQVQAVFRDSRGYLWVGTKYGFCKYNIENFEQFSPKQNVIGYYVTGFGEDSKGNIYIQSPQVGITKYNGKTFTRLRTGVPEHNSIQSFTIDKQNKIYTISNEGKLHTFIKDSLVALNWPSLKNKIVKSLTYDKSSQYLFGLVESVGLVYLTPKQLIPVIPPQIYPLNYLSASLITARNGQKVLIISQKDNSNLYYTHTPSAGWQAFLSVNDKQVTVLRTVDFDWFFNYQQKTYLLEANTKQTHQISPIAFDEMSGKALAYAPNGTWGATEKGLVFVSQNGFRYFSEQEVSTTWSVVEDAEQRIWTLNWGKPIRRFNGQKFETVTGYREVLKKRISQVNDNEGAMGDSWYYQPIKDKFGHLWFAHTMGMMQYDGKRFEFLISPKTQTPIAMNLLEDPSRNLIIQGGEGAVYFWENKPPFRVISRTIKDGFLSLYVLCSILEKPGVYWFGNSKSIIRYDYNRKQLKEYSAQKGNWNGRTCMAMYVDNRGTLWIGSGRTGLYSFDVKTDSFISIPNPFLNEVAKSITQLDADHLLIAGNKDLYVMDLKAWYASKKVVLKCFNHNNGFIGLEPNQNSFFKDSKGRVWIPSGTVLSVVDPKKLDLSPGQVSTYFTRLNGERIGFTHAQQDSIHALPHGTGDVRLEFESVGDDKPFNSQYSYYIEGINNDWTAWQQEPVITLSHLASGIYTVRVKARTGSTEAKSNEAVLRFKVSVYPWQSPYFPYYASGLLIALLAGSGYLYWQSQLRQREVRKQQKQLKEQETTAERQGQMVKTLQVQTAQAQMNPHFTFNVLNTLQALIFRQETEKANENIVNLSKLMRSYLNASISSDGTAASLEQGLITLDHEIELLRMYLGFEEVAYRDRFEVDINIHPDLKLDFYRIPPLLIQPFVENAIKHGVLPNENQFGHIWVRFWLDADETLVCEVEDDGIGREQSRIRKENAIQTYTSEGTNLVKQRVDLLNQLGYQIHIETLDREGGGTKVIVRMFDQLI